MGHCDRCDGDDGLSYTCNYCGGRFCGRHRLPERHRCVGLAAADDGGKWFDEKLSTARRRTNVVDAGGTLSEPRASAVADAGALRWVAALAALALAAAGLLYAVGVLA